MTPGPLLARLGTILAAQAIPWAAAVVIAIGGYYLAHWLGFNFPLAFALIVGVIAGLALGFLADGWLLAARRREEDPDAGAIPCPRCGYDLTGGESPHCPECGEELPINYRRRFHA